MDALRLLTPFGIPVSGLIHVGANTGQEAEAYRQAGIRTVVYVEPTPAAFAVLESRLRGMPGHHAVQAICSATSGETVLLNVASNNAESSSLFALGNHGVLYPDIVYTERLELLTTTVDDIVDAQFAGSALNMMVIDVQGAELLVLRGAERTLGGIDAVYCEIADIALYEGSCTWPEIEAFLRERGFRLKNLAINIHNWGNALFVKETSYISVLRLQTIDRPGANIALGKPAVQSSLSPYSGPDDAQGAVNGRITGGFGFHTDIEDCPWWQVDLLEILPLQEIIVFNRLDDCGARAHSLVVSLSQDDVTFVPVHAQQGVPFGGRDGRPARIVLDRVPARYVRIALTATDYLHLDEVEVYAAS